MTASKTMYSCSSIDQELSSRQIAFVLIFNMINIIFQYLNNNSVAIMSHGDEHVKSGMQKDDSTGAPAIALSVVICE